MAAVRRDDGHADYRNRAARPMGKSIPALPGRPRRNSDALTAALVGARLTVCCRTCYCRTCRREIYGNSSRVVRLIAIGGYSLGAALGDPPQRRPQHTLADHVAGL